MANRSTTQAGDILAASTWGGSLPAAGDSLYIRHGTTLTGGTLTAALAYVDKDMGGSLTVAGNSVISAALTLPRCASIVLSADAIVTVNGNVSVIAGSDIYSGAIQLNDNARLTINGHAAASNGDNGGDGANGENGSESEGNPVNGAAGSDGTIGRNGTPVIHFVGANCVALINGNATAGNGGNGGNGGSGGNGYSTAGGGADGGAGGAGAQAGSGGSVFYCAGTNPTFAVTGTVTAGTAGSGGAIGSNGSNGDPTGNGGAGGNGGVGGNGGLVANGSNVPTLRYSLVRGTFTMPAASDVKTGTAYGLGNATIGTLSGTYPAAGQVITGVSFGPTGAEYTGNVTLPSAGQVLSGVSFGAGNGTAGTVALPAPGDVRSGTSYGVGNATSGTLTLPMANQVLSSVSYGAAGTEYTGTVTLPTGGQVLTGVNFGAGNATAGTVILPTADQVLTGVQYGAAGTEFTGTAIAGEADGTVYCTPPQFLDPEYAQAYVTTSSVNVSTPVGGQSIAGRIPASGNGQLGQRFSVPVAKSGTLTTRTSNSAGVITVTGLTGISTGDLVDVYWASGARYGCECTVSGDFVTIANGAGSALLLLHEESQDCDECAARDRRWTAARKAVLTGWVVAGGWSHW